MAAGDRQNMNVWLLVALGALGMLLLVLLIWLIIYLVKRRRHADEAEA